MIKFIKTFETVGAKGGSLFSEKNGFSVESVEKEGRSVSIVVPALFWMRSYIQNKFNLVVKSFW
jgi:hypothetical protein